MIKALNLSFKNRIAFNYIISSAVFICIVFVFIFQVVKYSVNNHINEEIYDELTKHLDDVSTDDNDTYLIQVDQWRAREHNSISVNPVFVQFYDVNGDEIDKSPNLKGKNLTLLDEANNDKFVNSSLNSIPIRQIQTPILNNKKVELFPDFLLGGMMDASNYNDGLRGGKIRIRAKIDELDKKTLVITEIPFTTTTTSLIDSIIKANDTGKIKIKKVIDNTAKDVEIQIQLAPGISPDVTIDALYAFTDCEVSISPNACVIIEDKPHFMGVGEILRVSTNQTVDLLRQELEIRKGELMEKVLFSSLEKIFIENRIYRDIEECTTWDAVMAAILVGLDAGFEVLLIRVRIDIGEERATKARLFQHIERRHPIERAVGQRHRAELEHLAVDALRALVPRRAVGEPGDQPLALGVPGLAAVVEGAGQVTLRTREHVALEDAGPEAALEHLLRFAREAARHQAFHEAARFYGLCG